jgi:hypothetical protein
MSGLERRLQTIQSVAGHAIVIVAVSVVFIFLAIITDGWITPQFYNANDNGLAALGVALMWGVPLVLIYLWIRFILIEIRILGRIK